MRHITIAHLYHTAGWDGTSALLNGPNLLYQIIDRFSPHVIANVFMGHIHDEVRYIYYACVNQHYIMIFNWTYIYLS